MHRPSQSDNLPVQVTIRQLEGEVGIEVSRRLTTANPDYFAAYAMERLPCYYEIADRLDNAAAAASRQRLMLGAFVADAVVGCVLAEPVEPLRDSESGNDYWAPVAEQYSDHELGVFATLWRDLSASIIEAPVGSLLIHSLCVDRPYRGKCIAQLLLSQVVERLDDNELESLVVKVARVKRHVALCETLGFRAVDKTFSFADRLRFGCWGSVLLRYNLLAKR